MEPVDSSNKQSLINKDDPQMPMEDSTLKGNTCYIKFELSIQDFGCGISEE